MENYSVKNGKIYSDNGLPHSPRWFCDGRTAIEVSNEAISEVDFFGPKLRGNYRVFKKRFWHGIRFFLNDNSKRTVLKPKKCEILPFGFKSKSETFEYGIYVADDRIFLVVTPDFDCNLDVEIDDNTLFYPETHEHKNTGMGGGERVWEKFRIEDNCLVAKYTENGSETFVSFSSNKELSFRQTPKNTKYVLTLNGLKKGEKSVVCLALSNYSFRDYEGYEQLIENQYARYEKVAKRMPVLKSSHPLLNQFFELAPMYHESLKTTDVKGALRAQSTCYWVWGWDTMTSNNCAFYWGDMEAIAEMLECFEKYSHPELGIAHAFGFDMSVSDSAAPPPAQGMYITLLDLYRIAGGDFKKHYAYAKKLTKTIFDSEVNNTGFCIGTSLYPDHRALVNETGNDISTFNNTVSYCAIRSMEKLAKAAGDAETEQKSKAFADRMLENFEDIMYNEGIGFIDSSVDATTYEKRNVPTNNAVKWENNYCGELVSKRGEQYLKFYEENLVSPSGIRPVPEWSEVYDADANQLHCWWTVMSEFYTRLINKYDRPDLINQYASWVEYWTEKLMCPEGISCYDNEYEVPYDNWNARCGTWHGYNMRGFYNSLVHAFVGVDFDENGLNIYPYSGEELELNNLHFGERTFDIKMSGSGKNVKKVIFNGEDLGSILTVPFEKMQSTNTVEVIRG